MRKPITATLNSGRIVGCNLWITHLELQIQFGRGKQRCSVRVPVSAMKNILKYLEKEKKIRA
jgi:hypothetical protein